MPGGAKMKLPEPNHSIFSAYDMRRIEEANAEIRSQTVNQEGIMEIVEIDVLDGNEKITVAVGSHDEAIRLKKYVADATAAFTRSEETGLQFDDALRIARGCTDYGGGYCGNTEQFEIYQGGIHTVIAALKAASKTGLKDTQIKALHLIGAK